MIVIGMETVEIYFADRAGHKGINVARAQCRAGTCQGIAPAGKHSERQSGGLQHQG
jgi:hypothetical protein